MSFVTKMHRHKNNGSESRCPGGTATRRHENGMEGLDSLGRMEMKSPRTLSAYHPRRLDSEQRERERNREERQDAAAELPLRVRVRVAVAAAVLLLPALLWRSPRGSADRGGQAADGAGGDDQGGQDGGGGGGAPGAASQVQAPGAHQEEVPGARPR